MSRTTPVHRRALSGLVACAASAAVLCSAPGAAAAADPPAGARIDMKVLLLSANGAEAGYTAWKAQLERDGVPYDVIVADAADGALTAARLQDGDRAKYQAVILASGDLTRDVGDNQFLTALTDAEWATLNAFQAKFGIRRIADDTTPNPNHGLSGGTGQSLDGRATTLTPAGRRLFSDLKGPVDFEDRSPEVLETWGYPSSVAPATERPAGSSFTPLLTGTDGAVYMGVFTAADGVEEMVATFNGNVNQLHAALLRAGQLRWVTKGVHLGLNRRYFTTQIDDVFLPDDRWDTERNRTLVDGEPGNPDEEVRCDADAATAAPDCRPIRMDATDVDVLSSWQKANGLRLDMAFNGSGSVEHAESTGAPDPLLAALKAKVSEFYWINHTFTHANLDNASAATIRDEIAANQAWARQNGIPIDATELVTGEHSGLANPGTPGALAATGIKWIAADNSRQPDQYAIGAATTVPRHPSNVYYNVGTREEQLDEYNYIYLTVAEGGRCAAPRTDCRTQAATWEQYVASEADIMLGHVLGNDPRPHYAHQNNLTEGRTLYPVLDALLARYNAKVAVRPDQPTLTQAGLELQRRKAWSTAKAKVTGYLKDGVVTLQASEPTAVPITGTDVGTTQGGQAGAERSGWTTVSATATAPVTATSPTVLPSAGNALGGPQGTTPLTTPAPAVPAPKPAAPRTAAKAPKALLTGLKLIPSRFSVAGRKPKRGRPVDGTVISAQAAQAVTLRMTVQRKRGKRYRTVGSFTRRAKAGTVAIRFDGKVRGKLLARGTYRMRVAATASRTKARQAPRTLAFRVVKR